MKSYIKKALRSLGIQVMYLKSKRILPALNIDNVEIVVRFFQLMNKRISLIQIGARDGVTSDSIYKYIRERNIDAY